MQTLPLDTIPLNTNPTVLDSLPAPSPAALQCAEAFLRNTFRNDLARYIEGVVQTELVSHKEQTESRITARDRHWQNDYNRMESYRDAAIERAKRAKQQLVDLAVQIDGSIAGLENSIELQKRLHQPFLHRDSAPRFLSSRAAA